MTQQQAKEMADLFREIGGFSKVSATNPTLIAIPDDNAWSVELKCVNSKSGNRSIEIVRDYAPKMAKAIARKAKGKSTKRDQAAFARMAAEKEMASE